MNNNEPNNLKDNVLKAIQSGSVKMRPRWQFVLRASLLVVGVFLAVLTLLYVSSFTVFVLRHSGIWFVSGFGLRGAEEFLFSLPWLLILFSVIFIVIVEVLVRHYAFAYGKPLLYSTLGVIGFVIVGGVVVSLTPLHRGLFSQARNNHLPIAGGLYRSYGGNQSDNVVVGVISSKIDSGYELNDRENQMLQIIVDDQTKFPYGENIDVNDTVVVFGNRMDDTIQAYDIRELEEKFPEFEGRPMFGPSPADMNYPAH